MEAEAKRLFKVMQKAKCIVDYKYFTKTIRGVAKQQGVPGGARSGFAGNQGLLFTVGFGKTTTPKDVF